MEGINCTLKESYNRSSLKTHYVSIFLRKMFMSVFLFLCGLTFASTATAQCENLFTVTTTRTYSLATDKTTYTFAVTNTGSKHALSHFGITFDYCPGQEPVFLNGALISYSVNGTTFTSLGAANYAVDPSQNCFTTPILKFDFGQGNIGNTTYYRLVVNGYWIGNFSNVIFKYATSCCTQPYPGTRICFQEPGPPLLICAPGTVQLACNQPLPAPNPGGIKVTGSCPEGAPTVTFVSDVLTSTVGCVQTWTRTYKATDACGGTSTCTIIYVRTVDLVKPTITLTALSPTPLLCNPTTAQIAAAFGAATVSDNCSQGLTATGVVGTESGSGCSFSTTKSWTVTDACGNTQTAMQTVSYTRDVVKPTVSNAPPAAIVAMCTATFSTLPWVAPVFTDLCGSVEVISVVTTPGAEITTCPKIYVRVWTVSDACGNTASFTQTITVPCCEGCSPGFWKNHTSLWDEFADYPVVQMPAGKKFITTTNFNTYFNLPAGTNGFSNSLTMEGAIGQGGGDCKAFARHAVAALLSSASGLNIGYPTGTSDFTSLYNTIQAALLSGNCGGTLFSQLEAISNGDHTNCGVFEGVITRNEQVNPEPQVSVSAFPNPFTDRIVFTIKSKVSGSASFDLYGLLGEKVTTLYQGQIEKGAIKTLIYEVPQGNRKTMVYQLRIGSKIVTGKVIYPN